MSKEYYEQVNQYYNFDTKNYEKRYYANEAYQKIRNSFRKESEKISGEKILEIGFGTGIDLLYFGSKYPDSQFFGLDVSQYMNEYAQENIIKNNLTNIQIAKGSVEQIELCFPEVKFDKIHIFFGALNTVQNIDEIQQHLKNCLSTQGKMMITFVNKRYALGILKSLIKLRFKESVQRLGKTWRGYSPNKFIKSRCYTSREIKKHFHQFEITKKRGYSILFPAWYENNIYQKWPKLSNFFWKVDIWLQNTFFWNLGEYSLYVFKHK